jgi:hypothetical protein
MNESSPIAIVAESEAIELVSGVFPDLQEIKYSEMNTAFAIIKIFFFMI